MNVIDEKNPAEVAAAVYADEAAKEAQAQRELEIEQRRLAAINEKLKEVRLEVREQKLIAGVKDAYDNLMFEWALDNDLKERFAKPYVKPNFAVLGGRR